MREGMTKQYPGRRFYQARVILLFTALILNWGVASESDTIAKNVLFLVVDDMKDWVGCLGGYEGTVYTPNIDRLAARGTLFANAHCPSPKCAPSRAAVMTGLMPSTTGLYENGHWWYANYPDIITIPGHFKENGYRVVGSGKIFHHTAGNHPASPWHDFRKLLFRDDPWFRSVKLNYPWSEDGPYPEDFPFSGVKGLGHENDWGSLGYAEEDYDDTRMADYAIDFLENDPTQPFFLACGLFRPHLPWHVPEKYFDLYPLEEIVLPPMQEGDLEDVPERGKALAEARRSDWDRIRNAGKWKEAIRAYLASITYADAQLGRVLDALDESGAAQNTVVVFWSDHGWHLGEKEHWHKTTLWEEATQIPFIISAPGFESAVSNRAVGLIDLFPTLNELCDLPALREQDGKSLVPLLRDPDAEWKHPAVIEYQRGNAAVRSDRYRYILYVDGGEELYDLEQDPNEWENRAGEESLFEVKAELKKWLPKKWAASARTKSAFEFDPDTFTWTEKATGKIISDGASESVD
ncbi:MAG: sulfatase [Verrucomicrobiota bacterium]